MWQYISFLLADLGELLPKPWRNIQWTAEYVEICGNLSHYELGHHKSCDSSRWLKYFNIQTRTRSNASICNCLKFINWYLLLNVFNLLLRGYIMPIFNSGALLIYHSVIYSLKQSLFILFWPFIQPLSSQKLPLSRLLPAPDAT